MAKRNIVLKKEVQLDLFEVKTKQEFTEEQKNFIEYDGNDSVVLSSCAGSGKTFSCVQRLKKLLERGVDPNRIIFFSFTRDAVNELSSRVEREGIDVQSKTKKDGIKITTIHSFCGGVLAQTGKQKAVSDFFDFIEWYKERYKPRYGATQSDKEEFHNTIENLYEDSVFISSSIASFKLQSAEKIKAKVPEFMTEYNIFLREKKARDFSDMLIEVRDMFTEERWLRMFKGKYDYIFIDEYQDTSSIQLQIVLALNAKYYYLIGDKNQSIYGFSGSNCELLENMVKRRRTTVEMNLSVNFRSDKNIVENSNNFSTLRAVAKSGEDGYVDNNIILKIDDLIELLKTEDEVAVLVRTNSVIKKLECQLLKRKVPMSYFNFISHKDVEHFKKGQITDSLKNKLSQVREYFGNDENTIAFIERFKKMNKFVTTIHKSKGREFHTCVVVNSVSPNLLQQNPNFHKLSKKQVAAISFDLDDEDDVEPRNIHYVAVSRSKHKLYYMIYMPK